MKKGKSAPENTKVSDTLATKIENVLLHSQLVPQQIRQRAEAEIKQQLERLQAEFNRLIVDARKETGAAVDAIYNTQTKSFEAKK